MKQKLFILTLLMAVTLSAEAVRERTRIETQVVPHPYWAECTKVYRIVEQENPYIPNTWSTVSVTLVQDTCTDSVE